MIRLQIVMECSKIIKKVDRKRKKLNLTILLYIY